MRMKWTSRKAESQQVTEQERMAREQLLGALSDDVLAQISGGSAALKSECHTGSLA